MNGHRRLRLGRATEGFDPVGRVEIFLFWRDAWVGVFVSDFAVYVCPLPFLVIRVSKGRRS
jgi:hypothetical protein